jgi:hypothetical protein
MPEPELPIDNLHGVIFDAGMFLGNVAFVGFVPRLGDEVAETVGGTLLLVAVFTQIAGAWWKKGFLRRRLALRKLPPPRGFLRGFMSVLLFLHFILFSMMTLFAFALLGIYREHSKSAVSADAWVGIALLVGAVATLLVRAASRPKEGSAEARTAPAWLEFGADGLLWVSMCLVTRIFWDGLVGMIEPASGIGLGWEGIVLLAASCALFVFLYLPGRYLFLVEDCQSGQTWLQVSVVMLPIVWLVFVG